MARKRLVAVVRLREAVSATELPQLERDQDTDEDRRRRKRSKAKKRKQRQAREAVPFLARIREAQIHKTGGGYEVSLLREGPGNQNDRNWYSADALRRAVSEGVFEGAQCYADHPTPSEERERPERSVRHLVGHFVEARFVDGNPAEVRAKFVPISGAGYEWVTSLIESALASPKGRPLVGLSIEGFGHAPDQKDIDGKTYNVVREITSLGSVDLVTRAGAGGRFIRQLSESLAGARASVGAAPELSAGKLQARVRKALVRLEEGLADEDDQRVRKAFVALQEAASATVKRPTPKPTPRRAKSGEVAKLKAEVRKADKRRRVAEVKVEVADRAKLAGRLLREVDVPGVVREAWFEDLVERKDEPAMRRALERRQAERRDQLLELRESLGLCDVEGAGPREPLRPAAPADTGLLYRLGLDPDEYLEAS